MSFNTSQQEKLEKSGYSAFIVGGYVRDKLLDIKTNDIDEAMIDFYVDLINSISKKEVSSKSILAEVDNVYAETGKVRIPQDFMENHLSFVSYQSIGRFKVQTEGVLYKTNRMW